MVILRSSLTVMVYHIRTALYDGVLWMVYNIIASF